MNVAARACEKWLTQLPKNDAVNSDDWVSLHHSGQWVCTARLWWVQSDSDPDPPHARVESDTVLAPPENLEVNVRVVFPLAGRKTMRNVLEIEDTWRDVSQTLKELHRKTRQVTTMGGLRWLGGSRTLTKSAREGSGGRWLFGSLFHTKLRIGDSTCCVKRRHFGGYSLPWWLIIALPVKEQSLINS